MIREIFGLATLVFSGWYELSTARVCEKKLGEVIRDAIVFMTSFLIIYGGIGDFYFDLLKLLKAEIKELPSYLSIIFSGFLAVATFRSAAELIRITRRGEEKEDPGLRAVKIGTEMVMVFLGILISGILILLILGIKWWKYETIVYSTLVGFFVWMIVWFNLPRTYSPSLFKVLAVLFVSIHLVVGVLCGKAYKKGWVPAKESYFEFAERKKKEEKEKILAFERERVLKKKERKVLPPRKAVIPREILIPRMIYFDEEKIIKVKPGEKVRLIFRPNWSWIWKDILGYDIFINGVKYEIERKDLLEGNAIGFDFENAENVPKKIIVRVSERIIFERARANKNK
ncbi:MAG TPA: hypothetical protein ENF31_01215 [bacterium]|nr:hypothetical protein [bacterium]